MLIRSDGLGDARCPRCGAAGVEVFRETLAAHVPAARLSDLSATAFFCPDAHCTIAYFDLFERFIAADELLHPVYPKDAEAPMCPCFGLTRDDVEADALEATPTRLRALSVRSKGPEAQCAVRSPSGRCCMPEVQRYYMKLRSAGG